MLKSKWVQWVGGVVLILTLLGTWVLIVGVLYGFVAKIALAIIGD